MRSNISLVKNILKNLRNPDQLDNHPWVNSLFVQEYVSNNPALHQRNPGYQLAAAVSDLFLKAMPSVYPRQGIRLDTRWGAFGILASLYFTPFVFGMPHPDSLRDAWGKIDQAILLFRFGKERMASLSQEDIEQYKLVGNEMHVSPISTISDWKRKGIKQLADVITEQERYLSQIAPGLSVGRSSKSDSLRSESGKKEGDRFSEKSIRSRIGRLWISALIGLVLIAGLIFGGVKAYRVYKLVDLVRGDLSQVQNLVAQPYDKVKIQNTVELLDKVAQDIHNLESETSPYLRILGPLLKWVPEYGEDIAAGADILDMADRIVTSLQIVYQVGDPLYETLQTDHVSLDSGHITMLFVQAQPQLAQARQELDSALEIWEKLNIEDFSAPTKAILYEIEHPLHLLDSGLSISEALPKLLGASSEGPKTYLILLQNEDELRPTGGFITAIIKVIVKDGNLIGFEFEDSEGQEDWSLPYPDAPWQLRQYMNSPVIVLRDANWFTDFATTASWVEYLYAYTHQHSLDGIIAIDQQFLVALLNVIGPVNVEGSSDPISGSNVIEFMRAEKTPEVQPQPQNWSRKSSIKNISVAIINKLFSSLNDVNVLAMVEMVVRMLNERHLLLQIDDPQTSSILADLDWDGGIRPGSGDFIMLVDTNVGFNKVNAAVTSSINYDVNLTQLNQPTSALTLTQTNHSPGTQSCAQYEKHKLEDSRYPINYCYWNYLRVYVTGETQIIDATPQQISANWWLIPQKAVPARVDRLDENILGVQVYGTLMAVPVGQTNVTRFGFALPARVVSCEPETKQCTYTLKIKKQPGTGAIPAKVRVYLPGAARVELLVNLTATIEDSNVMVETSLRDDVIVTVVFALP